MGVGATALAAAAVIWLWPRGAYEPPGSYFYDLSEKKLYAAPRNAFAPEDGIGGESGDGVEAIVFKCPQCPADRLETMYLRTHTPEYKRRHEEARRAGTAVEGLTREWESEHTLISRVDPIAWHKASSDEAIKIGSSRGGRCPEHGLALKPCRPS